jgi:hypothetical protein
LRIGFSTWWGLAPLRLPSLPKEADHRPDQIREALKRDLEAARYAAERRANTREYDAEREEGFS